MRAPTRRYVRAAALAALALALCVPVASAQNGTERPIVYVVVIDGLDGDRVDMGKAPFISSLLRGEGASATYWRESRAVMISETNPNHTAMMTGAYAGTSGIPANAFALYGPLSNEDSCVLTGPEDLTMRPFETSGESSTCPVAETAFESVLRQGNPDGLATAAVFGKPKLGLIFSGKNFDPSRRDADYIWAPCSSSDEDDEYCESVPTNPVTGYAVDDATVMDRVLSSIEPGIQVNGETRRPDLTFVNLHQVDSAGHGFGTDTGVYDEAIALADSEIRRLVTKLRDRGEWDRTVLLLVSDHSMDTTPNKINLKGEFNDAGIPDSAFLPIDNGGSDSIYIADRVSNDRFALLKRMRAIALGINGVDEALYREPNPEDGGDAHTMDTAHPGWNLAGPRAPDLIVTAKPGFAFTEPSGSSNPIPGNHGGSSTRDNFMAAISGGSFVRQQTLEGERDPRLDDTLKNALQAENVDVAATALGLLGLAAPEDNQGRFLFEAFDRGSLPGGGRPARRNLQNLRVTSRRGRTCAYRAAWGPDGGVYDVQIRSGGRWTRARRRIESNVIRWRGRAGRRYAFRVRARAASGVHSAWSMRRASGRSCGGR